MPRATLTAAERASRAFGRPSLRRTSKRLRARAALRQLRRTPLHPKPLTPWQALPAFLGS